LNIYAARVVSIKLKKLYPGDYTAMLPKNEELGIMRDIYLNSRELNGKLV